MPFILNSDYQLLLNIVIVDILTFLDNKWGLLYNHMLKISIVSPSV